MQRQQNHHGVLVLLLSSFLFALMSVFARFVPHEIGTFYQLFLRSILMGGIFLLTGLGYKQLTAIKQKDVPLFFLRGLFVVGDFGSFFIAVNHLPLGTTLFLMYAGFILTSYLYGRLVFHEQLDRIKILSFLSALGGLVIVYAGGLFALGNMFVLLALMTGVCFGLLTATSKHLTDRYSINQVNAVAYLTAAVISVPLLLLTKEIVTFILPLATWIFFVAYGLLGVVVFYTTLYGFKYVEAQKASLLLLGEIIFVIIIGVLFYKEIPTLNTIIGGVLIVVALALPNIKFKG